MNDKCQRSSFLLLLLLLFDSWQIKPMYLYYECNGNVFRFLRKIHLASLDFW